MRILIGVHQFFPIYYTGTERYVLNLSKQLQKFGNHVKVLTYAFKEEKGLIKSQWTSLLKKEYSYEGISVVALKHEKKPDDLSFLFDFMDIEIYNEVQGIIKNEGFDIYHCAHPLRIASSIKAAKDLGLKVVFMLTDYFMMCPMGIMLRTDNTLCDGPAEGLNCIKYCFTNVTMERVKQRFSDSRLLISLSDALLSPSQFLIAMFDYTGFIPMSRFTLCRHGFDYSRKKQLFKEKISSFITFGYIGTIQYHKGIHIMVNAFKKIKNPNIRLQIWGGALHETEYQKSVIELSKKDPRIEYKGFYDYNEIHKVLENIDVVIVPSIWYENAPLTIMTSLAYGVPVIASNIGGMQEAVNNKNGLLFNVGNCKDLSKKIKLLADNPDLIKKISESIQYPIRIEEEAFNTEQIYKKLLSNGKQ